jgi:predicted DNA-binding protein (UPF0251 family)
MISESARENGISRATVSKNIMVCRKEVVKQLTELYKSNFRA